MKQNLWSVLAVMCLLGVSATLAQGQAAEVKEKPPMYSYAAFWAIPRAQWADYEKMNAGQLKFVEKALSAGSIVGYGDDSNLIHQPDGATHDTWFSAMSMAALLNVLDDIYKSGSPTNSVFATATKHWDGMLVSRYYNWHSGSWKGIYTHGSTYKLKADAPTDALDVLSKNLFVPLLEKLLADGTIHEYEVDTEAVHTESPSTFWIFYVAANAESLDKVNAALLASLKAYPLTGPAFGSMVDYSEHRDYLMRSNATFK
jgi:hypothetical protein